MNKLDLDYQNLLQDILDNGVKKETRNGGTISVFGRQIRHKMSEGFPVLTTKKIAWKTMVTELLWFLRGDTNIKFLVDNDCHIWDGDAYKAYENNFVGYDDIPSKDWFILQIKTNDEFAKKFGDLGPVYGKQWRSWEKTQSYKVHEGGDDYSIEYRQSPIDQIQNLINDLKTNPDSRRLMVTAWNPADLPNQVLPPCHYGFQVYTRKLSIEERIAEHRRRGYVPNIDPLDYVPERAISLMFNMRSNDVPLGLPFNLASYGLLLEILAKQVNMVPDELIVNLGDAHIYLNQIDGVKEQLTREPFELPTLNQFPTYEGSRPSIESYVIGDFTLKNYQSHPSIKMPLSN